MNTLQNFSKGLVKENPVLVLVLGTCPTLATSTSISNALGMGLAATVVLLCSNIVISALRKVIPDKVRIPCYIVLIAGFVTMVQMLVKAFAPALDAALGIYLPLIVVNCIILGRAEMFANKNKVFDSAVLSARYSATAPSSVCLSPYFTTTTSRFSRWLPAASSFSDFSLRRSTSSPPTSPRNRISAARAVRRLRSARTPA